jgi:hypothetical protein
MKIDLNKYSQKVLDRINQNKKGTDFTTSQIDNSLKKVNKTQESSKSSYEVMKKDYKKLFARLEFKKGWSRDEL